MTFSEEQLEWIVCEVVRRLLEIASKSVGETLPQQCSTGNEITLSELAINDRVITMRTIEGKLHGVSQVRITPRR